MASQGPVLGMMNFIDSITSGSDSEKARENIAVTVTYFCFALVACVVCHGFSDMDFSTVLTAGAGVQCLGFYMLLQKARFTHSVAGISCKTLEMYVLAFLFRLPCTCLRNGYLPVDRSGDWVYQVADFSSLLIIIQLIYCIQKKYSDTYQKEDDTMPVWNALPACVIGAILLHGDLNHSFFFDTLWTMSMNIETIAMMPQLWMLAKKGGVVEALTANYVACLFATACFKLAFWWYGHEEIGDEEDPTLYHIMARYWVAGAHAMQVLLSADFMFHYIKAGSCGSSFSTSSRGGGMVLPTGMDI